MVRLPPRQSVLTRSASPPVARALAVQRRRRLPAPAAAPRRLPLRAGLLRARAPARPRSRRPAATSSARSPTCATSCRDRAAAVAAELLALVDAEYAAFLALGDSLRGGDERVAEARVGLLGFERGAREVREAVARRRADVARACADGARVRGEVALGRELLAAAEKVELLEASLADAGSELSDDDEDGDEPVGLGRLRRLVLAFVSARQQIDRIRTQHPDVPYANVLDRKATQIRNTLVLDLGAALRLHARGGSRAQAGLIKVMKLYADMGESASAVEALKEAKMRLALEIHKYIIADYSHAIHRGSEALSIFGLTADVIRSTTV